MESFYNRDSVAAFLHGYCGTHALRRDVPFRHGFREDLNSDKKSTALHGKCAIILALWLF
jgi:hypothetical protein